MTSLQSLLMESQPDRSGAETDLHFAPQQPSPSIASGEGCSANSADSQSLVMSGRSQQKQFESEINKTVDDQGCIALQNQSGV